MIPPSEDFAYALVRLDLTCQIEVNHRGGDGHKGTVEAVEPSAVTGEDAARILDAELTFHQRLYQVAPCTEEDYGEGESQPYP